MSLLKSRSYAAKLLTSSSFPLMLRNFARRSPYNKRSDSVLWEKPIHPQKNTKTNVTTQNTTKTSITQRMRTYLGRSVGRTTSAQPVWLKNQTGLRDPNLPNNPPYEDRGPTTNLRGEAIKLICMLYVISML